MTGSPRWWRIGRPALASLGLALALALGPIGLDPGPAAAAEGPAGPPSADWAQIESYLDEQARLHRLPGMAVAIAHGGQVVFAHGLGSGRPGESVTPQTPFFIASLSKSLTATAVLQLVDSGRVELNAPVQRYLPWFRVADEAASGQITVRHLLHQTGGLSYQGYRVPLLPPETGMEANARRLAAAHLTAAPGTQFHYFNPNYVLLGLIVEAVSGQTFGAYLAEHILQPLGMARTFTELPPAQAAGLVQGHNAFLGFSLPRRQPFLPYELPSGFIISTAEDMGRYLAAHLAGERSGLLSAEGFATLHTPPAGVDSRYAMGWVAEERDGSPLMVHTGGLDTFSAVMWLLPAQDFGIVLLTNQASLLQSIYVNNGIMEGLTDLLLGDEPAQPTPAWLLHAGLGLLIIVTLGFWLVRFRRLASWRAGPRRRIGRLPVGVWLQLLLPGLILAGIAGSVYLAQGWVGMRVLFWYYAPDVSLWLALAAGLTLVEAAIKAGKTWRAS